MQGFLKFIMVYLLVISLTSFSFLPGRYFSSGEAKAFLGGLGGGGKGLIETVIVWGLGASAAYSLWQCSPATVKTSKTIGLLDKAGKAMPIFGQGGIGHSFYIFNIAAAAYWLQEVLANNESEQDTKEIIKGASGEEFIDKFGNTKVKNAQPESYRKAAAIERSNASINDKKGTMKKVVGTAMLAAAALALVEYIRHRELMVNQLKMVANNCKEVAAYYAKAESWAGLRNFYRTRKLLIPVGYCLPSNGVARPSLFSRIESNKTENFSLQGKQHLLVGGLQKDNHLLYNFFLARFENDEDNVMNPEPLKDTVSDTETLNAINKTSVELENAARLQCGETYAARAPGAPTPVTCLVCPAYMVRLEQYATQGLKRNIENIINANTTAQRNYKKIQESLFPAFKIQCGADSVDAKYLKTGNDAYERGEKFNCETLSRNTISSVDNDSLGLKLGQTHETKIGKSSTEIDRKKIESIVKKAEAYTTAELSPPSPSLELTAYTELMRNKTGKEDDLSKLGAVKAAKEGKKSVVKVAGIENIAEGGSEKSLMFGMDFSGLLTGSGLHYVPQTRALTYGVFGGITLWSGIQNGKDSDEHEKRAQEFDALADQLETKAGTEIETGEEEEPVGKPRQDRIRRIRTPRLAIARPLNASGLAGDNNTCVNFKGALDQGCKCRQSNTCGTIPPIDEAKLRGFSGSALLARSGVQVRNLANGLAQGNTKKVNGASAFFNKNSGAIKNLHGKLKRRAEKLARASGKSLNLAKDSDRLLKSFQDFAKKSAARAGFGGTNGAGASLASLNSLTKGGAAGSNAESEAFKVPSFNLPQYKSNGLSSRRTSSLDFNDDIASTPSAGESDISTGDVGEIDMDQVEEFSTDTINNNKGGNLFRIISNRYIRTANRKLFSGK